MNISRIIHSLLRFAMVVSALSIMALFTFTHASAASTANTHPAETHLLAQNQVTPVGRWSVTVYFLTGSLTGQQESASFTFAADGTLTSLASGVAGSGPLKGTGTWNSTSDTTFHFTINTPMYDSNGKETGYVHVEHDAVLLKHGTTFLSEVTGVFTLLDGTPVQSTRGDTVTDSMRV